MATKFVPYIRNFQCTECSWNTCQQHRDPNEVKHTKCVYCRRSAGDTTKEEQLYDALKKVS